MPAGCANDRINLGFVGVANMGTENLKAFIGREDIRVTALCDVDSRHLQAAQTLVNSHYGNADCTCFHDFRELNEWSGVDAVVITTPDHWHVPQAVHAALCAKDVYLEKPLTLSIAEGRRLCNVFAATGRILQTGSQQRSMPEFRKACELVQNGYLGRVTHIDVEIPNNNKTCNPTWDPMPVPAELDYNTWLGPAPWAEYHDQRCHYQFRFILDYSGGQVTNFGAHHLDIVQWALGMDDSGPTAAWGQAKWPQSGLFTTALEVDFGLRYASGTEVRCTTGESRLTFVGTEGQLSVERGAIATEPAALADMTLSPDDLRLYRSDNHYGNWLEAIRTRRPPACPPEVGHRSATCCHLANIAMRLGRELVWDPATETFPHDAEAQTLAGRIMREPWNSLLQRWETAATGHP